MFQQLSSNSLFLLLYCLSNISYLRGDTTTSHKDGPYEPIKINIPVKVWQQAFKPTPVFKSTATIVVPIHVNSDDDYVEDNLDENEIDDADENLNDTDLADDAIDNEETEVTTISIIEDETTVQHDVQDNTEVTTTAPSVTGQVTRFPCTCKNGQCGCCTGSLLQTMNMKACGNITFVPEDFVFDVKLNINNNTVLRRRVSASDPPPICFNPRRAPFVQVCVEISNIRIKNRNAFACLDINADIGGYDVYSASFRCFGLGTSGVQSGLKPKPVSSGPKPINLYGNGNSDDDDEPGLFDGGIFGGGDEGGGILGGNFFGGEGGSDSGDDSGVPFDDLGDVFDGFGDFLDGSR